MAIRLWQNRQLNWNVHRHPASVWKPKTVYARDRTPTAFYVDRVRFQLRFSLLPEDDLRPGF